MGDLQPAGPPGTGIDKQTKTRLAVTGGTAAATGGVFSFGLLTAMGMKEQFAAAETGQNQFAAIFAVTVFCLIVLVILVTGYLVMTGGAPRKAASAFWAGLGIFGLIAALGVVTLIVLTFSTTTVNAYINPDNDLTALKADPPLNLFAYANDDKDHPIPADKGKAIPLTFNSGNKYLAIDIRHFQDLSQRLQDLRDRRGENDGAQTIKDYLAKACGYSVVSQNMAAECKLVQPQELIQ